MQGYNCIVVFNPLRDKILFCKRTSDPYKGLYNLVGGKVEPGEGGAHAAYRELFEETGISDQDIYLKHMMDFTYYNQDCYMEVYVGTLNKQVILKPEKHPLFWLDTDEDFFSMDKFAGEGNIGHMMKQICIYGEGEQVENV